MLIINAESVPNNFPIQTETLWKHTLLLEHIIIAYKVRTLPISTLDNTFYEDFAIYFNQAWKYACSLHP